MPTRPLTHWVRKLSQKWLELAPYFISFEKKVMVEISFCMYRRYIRDNVITISLPIHKALNSVSFF